MSKTTVEDKVADEILERIDDHWNDIIQLPKNAAFVLIKIAILKPVRSALDGQKR